MKSKPSNSKLMSAFAAFNSKVQKKKTQKRSASQSTSTKSAQESPRNAKKKKLISENKDQNIDPEPETSNTTTKSKPISCGNIDAEKRFEWLIAPVSAETFFGEVWEKKPLRICRKGADHYKALFSCKDFDKILREKHLEYSRNIDIVSYVNGERKTLNPDGRAYAPVVWDFYQNGSSVRLLNPQTYSKPLWQLNSLLQEYFGSFVGANMYLTPPGSQGFAPHFDDIEAFVLQLEGRKHWKVYSPRSETECLPRFSSENFSQEEIGIPIMDFVLEPGDLLYFPRGYIHQANTVDNEHSLHITISTYQKNTWGDLLQLMLPRALQMAMEEDVEFRRSLPKNYLDYIGVANSDNNCPERDQFISKVMHLAKRLVKYLPIDSATDQKSKEFIHSSLPPCLSQKEKGCSIHGNGEMWVDGRVKNSVEIHPDTEVRLIRKRALRLIMEEDGVRVYHTLENSRVYQEQSPQYVELGAELAPAMEHFFNSYPAFVRVEELPLKNSTQQMDIATLLYDKGLLVTKDPLVAESDSE